MPSSDVVFCLTGDVRRNSRALRQLRALSEMGLVVDVCMLGADVADDLSMPHVRFHALSPPAPGGPRFFARAHRLFRRAAMRIPARIYHASDLYALPAMRSAARAHRARLVYDARELYAHVSAVTGRPLVQGFWRILEGHLIRHADAVFTVSASISEHLLCTYRIPPPTVLFNVPTYRPVTSAGRLRTLAGVDPEDVVVLHQGQMRTARGCERIVDAMADVEDAVMVFLGDGPLEPALRQLVARHGLKNRVRFIPPVSPDELLPLTADADFGVTLLENTCLNHRFALPNKLFEYLMAGVPVLASDLPEIRNVVEGFNVGCVVDPADREALVGSIRTMVSDKANRMHWAANTPRVFEQYDGDAAVYRFKQTYQALLG